MESLYGCIKKINNIMKIAIDISQTVYDTGVSKYTIELVNNLLMIDKKNEYVLFGNSFRSFQKLKNISKKLLVANKSVEKIYPLPPLITEVLWNRIHFSVDSLIGKVDVFHSSDWTQPRSKALKVTTVHDLAPIKFPKLHHPKIVSVIKRKLELVKKEVDQIIAVSQATKDDLVHFGINASRITVIHESFVNTKNIATKSAIKKVSKKYHLGDNYLLSVGVGLRKNTTRIIKAFEKMRSGENLKLVIVGSHNQKEEIRGVRFTGHVDNDELQVLYYGAKALVFPSIYEGFGIPILDGFNAGIPVVTSNLSSMKEVAGSAAILVDPYKVESIKNGIVKALELSVEYKKKGKERVKEFSWAKTAAMTLAVYEKAVT